MEPIKICTASHGGINQVCDSCKHNMENHPDFQGSRYEPEGKYQFLNPDICRLPVGPDRKFWIQYEAMELNS